MSGEAVPAPDLLPWIDIENLKRHPDIFAPGDLVTVTEKLHGTACCLTFHAGSGEVHVTSKGLGSQRLALVETPGNLYWRAVRGYGLPQIAAHLAGKLGAARIGIYGEVYGSGVQDLGYGVDARRELPGYAAFDVCADIGGQLRWLDPAGLPVGGLPLVPRLFDGPFDLAQVLDLAQGSETVSGGGAHVREGVVVRTADDKYSPVVGGRAIAKVVGDAYLTRKGGTEYE
jgi:RNA ligase (TIGR02306 family)